MNRIYVCSPYRGDKEKNLKKACAYCKSIAFWGNLPVAPHLYFPQFLDDDNHDERMNGIKMGLELLKDCDAMHVYGNDITEGMEMEIRKAIELEIPIMFKDEDGKEIDHETAGVDERLSRKLKDAIREVDELSDVSGKVSRFWLFRG